jgi:hypothetical protein
MNKTKTYIVLLAVTGLSHSVWAQQAHVNLDWNPHRNTQNLNPYGANLISPEVVTIAPSRFVSGRPMRGRTR